MRRHAIVLPLYLWAGVSLLVHLGSFAGTSSLAARIARTPAPVATRRAGVEAAPAPMELEFEPLPAAPVAPPLAAPVAPLPAPHARPRDDAPPPPPPPPPPPAPRPQPLHVNLVPTPPPPPPPPAQRPPMVQYVHQDTPSEDHAPTDPHYLAQSNRTVEDETVAQVRNLQQDNPSPQLGGTPHQTPDAHEGNADHTVSADARDVHGDRTVMPHEDTHPRPQTADPRVATALRPNATQAGDTRRPGNDRAPGDPHTPGDSAPQTPGDSALAAPSGANGNAAPSGNQGNGGQQGDASERLGVRGVGASRALAMLSPSYTQYEAIVGTEAIEREHRLALQRRSEARGTYEGQWQQTRAAIENFTPTVRVGNQTALRTAASPFAAYLTDMHRRIHRMFADGFLASLDALPANSPLQDESLHTTVEIVLERTGAVHRVGVVSMSGVLPFDVAAINAVRRAGPYGAAPEAILSGDGRVYLHWGFYRGQRQCGTFNVEPFILPHPHEETPDATHDDAPSEPPSAREAAEGV